LRKISSANAKSAGAASRRGSQPPRVTACSGIDALSHALETAVTNKRTQLSLVFSREALRLTLEGLPRVLKDPADLEARGSMLLGAALGGTAIENSMLGAAHAAANPLTAHFGVAHGHAVGLMLPHVIRFNAADPSVGQAYANAAYNSEFTADFLAHRVEEIFHFAGLPRSLRELRIQPEAIPQLANEAASQWTAQFNPRPVTAGEFEELYISAYERSG